MTLEAEISPRNLVDAPFPCPNCGHKKSWWLQWGTLNEAGKKDVKARYCAQCMQVNSEDADRCKAKSAYRQRGKK